jgi:hypothetical protein
MALRCFQLSWANDATQSLKSAEDPHDISSAEATIQKHNEMLEDIQTHYERYVLIHKLIDRSPCDVVIPLLNSRILFVASFVTLIHTIILVLSEEFKHLIRKRIGKGFC